MLYQTNQIRSVSGGVRPPPPQTSKRSRLLVSTTWPQSEILTRGTSSLTYGFTGFILLPAVLSGGDVGRNRHHPERISSRKGLLQPWLGSSAIRSTQVCWCPFPLPARRAGRVHQTLWVSPQTENIRRHTSCIHL